MFNKTVSIPPELPIYPLRRQIVFPHASFPLMVQEQGLLPIEAALVGDHLLGLVPVLSDAKIMGLHEFNHIGTACRITQVFRFPEGGAKVMLEGLVRIQLLSACRQTPYVMATVKVLNDPQTRGPIADALTQSVKALLKVALAYGRPLSADIAKMLNQISEPGELADLVAVYLTLDYADQQRLLDILQPLERLKEIYLLLTAEVQKLQLQGEVQSEVAKRIGKNQKEYLLREQLKQIQSELGDDDPQRADLNKLRRALEEAELPEEVVAVADRELERLARINPSSPEYSVARTYLECLSNLPWNRASEDVLDIHRAQQTLDEDHYNLTEVKERILEFLAVHSLKKSLKGPILCLVGPPGVGKTSLGRSIARAMGRMFIRISLGGIKDEAEIRGHRRTYIGAMPGRIIQEISRAGTRNPVFMLDEVDKIGKDFRGDPASALLEVLDPEQNDTFTDHYIDVPFDLSEVLFITTANVMDPVPAPLRDRMEVLRLSGYSDQEKLQIVRNYLLCKQIEANGLSEHPLDFDDAAIYKMIREYTREAGVRAIDRRMAAICRKVAREITQGAPERRRIAVEDVETLLGPRRYYLDVAAEEDRVGVATGLAWTETGGDIIFIEASRMVGRKELWLTGSLGEVMRESARTALSFVRGHCEEFGIETDFFEQSDLHIHVPAGAIPKDGPSAGVAIATALVSLLTGSPARRHVALTGELTLSGRILPIGGVKEKILAAHRAGATTVLLPTSNVDHLRDIDETIRGELRLVLVSSMKEVLSEALVELPGLKLRCRPGDSPLFPSNASP